jgi:D-glycero-alpha-D-manno-heptose-7-phosphate kinase
MDRHLVRCSRPCLQYRGASVAIRPCVGESALVVGSETFTLDAAEVAHPLLAACIRRRPLRYTATVEIGAGVPPGAGLGTSASVAVALLAALGAGRGEPCDPGVLARLAHLAETDLGWQSGVQDQQAAAHGGISEIRVDYPNADRRAIRVGADTAAALDAQLLTVYLGRPHTSSAIHESVIARLEGEDPEPWIGPLRAAAEAAIDALGTADLAAYGAALDAATLGQEEMHPELVCAEAHRIRAIARVHGALGMKVNGAGGNGGSITLLAPADERARDALREALLHDEVGCAAGWQILNLTLSNSGVAVDFGS